MPGRPILYGTTEEFLKYFGLDNIGNIPHLDELIGNFNTDKEKIKD